MTSPKGGGCLEASIDQHKLELGHFAGRNVHHFKCSRHNDNNYNTGKWGSGIKMSPAKKKYCKTRKFSQDKFSLIDQSKSFHSFNLHCSMTVLFYIITKVKISEAFNFYGFASSTKIAKINHR